jgi:hypothetical protein
MPGSARRLAVVVAALAAVVGACSGEEGEEEADPELPPRPPPTGMVEGTGPLTGLPVDSARARRPLLIVKIDNAPRARPQSGLNQADVVVEEAVEGGVTRFAAFYHSSDAAVVGPVRSARSTDIFLASGLNRPLFAYSGANAPFRHLIARSPLVDVGVDRLPDEYRRDRTRPAPYNQYSSTTRLIARAPRGAGPPPRLFPFRAAGQPSAGAGASPAAGVTIDFRGRIVTSVRDRWDAGTRTWKRSQDGVPHIDAAGAQVEPENVIVQFVRYRDTGFRDTSGSPVPEGELVGEGEAWILTDGRAVRGRWTKPSTEAVTQYVDSERSPLGLTPGQTWVELPEPGTATLDR